MKLFGKSEKTQRDLELEQFEELYRVSGDGVAHLDIEKALASASFQNALSELLDADLVVNDPK